MVPSLVNFYGIFRDPPIAHGGPVVSENYALLAPTSSGKGMKLTKPQCFTKAAKRFIRAAIVLALMIGAAHWLGYFKDEIPGVASAIAAPPDFDEDYYNDCILKNAKEGANIGASQLIAQACRYKAIPKKCRALPDAVGLLDPFHPPSERAKCVAACKSEGYYSRHFGECSTG
jgi:hypothetical protein